MTYHNIHLLLDVIFSIQVPRTILLAGCYSWTESGWTGRGCGDS